MFVSDSIQNGTRFHPIALLAAFPSVMITVIWVYMFAPIPTFVLVMLVRWLKLKRGWADLLAGILVGGGVATFMVVTTSAGMDEPWLRWAKISLLFAASGFVGALTYWLTARSLAAWWLKHHEENWFWGRRIP